MTTALIAGGAMVLGVTVGFGGKWLIAKFSKSSGLSNADKKHLGVMDKILILESVLLIAYTIADMWLFYMKGSEPSTLTASVFSICGIENGVMGWIKTNKTNNETTITTTTVEPLIDREEPPDVGKD